MPAPSLPRGLSAAQPLWLATEPGAGVLIRGTRPPHEFPERGRMVHPLDVHQLVDHHVVAHPCRHFREPPVERNAAAPRTGSPPPPLIPDGEPRDREAVLGRELEQAGPKPPLGERP